MEETEITPEKLTKQIADVRKTAGLTHWELSRLLNVPVCFTEILENGVLLRGEDDQLMRWHGCLFAEEELKNMAAGLSEGVKAKAGRGRNEDEAVFYLPVTINLDAILEELDGVAGCSLDLTASGEWQAAEMLAMKVRLYYSHLCMIGRKKTADVVKRRVLAGIAQREERL